MLCIYVVGAQIIDLMMLVIDITKGIQTQTAEVIYIYIYIYIYISVTVYSKCVLIAYLISNGF